MSYKQYLMPSGMPPSEAYKAVEVEAELVSKSVPMTDAPRTKPNPVSNVTAWCKPFKPYKGVTE